jgi:hypothetical protein
MTTSTLVGNTFLLFNFRKKNVSGPIKLLTTNEYKDIKSVDRLHELKIVQINVRNNHESISLQHCILQCDNYSVTQIGETNGGSNYFDPHLNRTLYYNCSKSFAENPIIFKLINLDGTDIKDDDLDLTVSLIVDIRV